MEPAAMEQMVQSNQDLLKLPAVQERMQVIFQEQVDNAQKMIASGVAVNDTNSSGWTCLHEACIFGNRKLVDLLLVNGADVQACDVNGRTALNVAIDNGHFEIAALLEQARVQQASINARA
tara:strand:- start:8420 stop:8782 length:363 start_codon:yes stop_codon:yes gene_type:complete